MDLGLQDKVVLVTGGSKGIGAGIVRRFLAEGVRVANVNRSKVEGEALEAEYAASGQECCFIQADLCVAENCRIAVEKTWERFGQIDVVVNNAGVNDGVGLDAGPAPAVAACDCEGYGRWVIHGVHTLIGMGMLSKSRRQLIERLTASGTACTAVTPNVF